MKPILITTWPIHLDYPLFRYNLERYRDYFASIWIGLTNHHQEVDYTNFLMDTIPFARFVPIKHTGLDWRNDAVNEVLNQITTNEPILFIEQDFLIRDVNFFEKVFKYDNEFVYFMEGVRVHPAFALLSRDYIEKTSRDFSAYPGIYGDHFAKFFSELPTSGIYLEELGVKNKIDFYHLNGLSQNYMNVKDHNPLYHAHDFLYYNFKCIDLPIKNHPQFIQIEKAIERSYGHSEEPHPFLDKFFP